MGNSPPTRNFASWPDSATSVGSASILASPLDSSALRIALNGNWGSPEKKREKPPATGGAWIGGSRRRPGPRERRRTSRAPPTARPCRRRSARPRPGANKLMPSSRRPLRDTSANFTSSCTCWLPTTWMRFATFSAWSWATSAARSGTRTSETSPESTTRSPAAETAIFSLGEELGELRAQAVEIAGHLQRDHQRLVPLVPERQIGRPDAPRGEQQLRRRDHLEVGDLRIGDRHPPDRLREDQAAGSARSRAPGS